VLTHLLKPIATHVNDDHSKYSLDYIYDDRIYLWYIFDGVSTTITWSTRPHTSFFRPPTSFLGLH